MARVFITGSNDGLGRDAARRLLEGGHTVVGHARSAEKTEALKRELPGLEDALVADLASVAQVRELAERANESGAFDVVIHNAGVYLESKRGDTEDGHAHVLAVNALAPYVLTALMTRPQRLIYMTSGLQSGAGTDLSDIDWTERTWSASRAYSESKLFDATLAAAVARRWPEVFTASVSPGWVATKMGGAGATDDYEAGSATQAWLAVTEDVTELRSGAFYFHEALGDEHPAVSDPGFQDALLAVFERLTGVALP